MKQFLAGVFIALIIVLGLYFMNNKSEHNQTVYESSIFIKEQIKNVSKLVVSEGHFSQVYNYKNSVQLFGDFLTADKSALVVINAEVTVAYDMSQLKYSLDEENKVVNIDFIPEEEIKIYPELEYFDIQSGLLNPFDEKDYNAIKESVKKIMTDKVNASSLKTNAKNRLISELSRIFFLVQSMGWTLEYNEQPIKDKSHLDDQLIINHPQPIID